MKRVLLIIGMFFLLTASAASAHIPELVTEDRNYTLEPVLVEDPEISYAYYGKLNGGPHQYKIISEEPFLLYVSLLAPYTGQEESSGLEFHIMKDGVKTVMMHNYTNWTKFYEEYGGDWYLQGPEYETEAEPGTYVIEVHSATNTEDYTLAIGKTERFGPGEILKTLIVLPIMKAFFWGNYYLLAGYIAAIIVLAAVIFLVYRFLRKRKKPKGKKRS